MINPAKSATRTTPAPTPTPAPMAVALEPPPWAGWGVFEGDDDVFGFGVEVGGDEDAVDNSLMVLKLPPAAGSDGLLTIVKTTGSSSRNIFEPVLLQQSSPSQQYRPLPQ